MNNLFRAIETALALQRAVGGYAFIRYMRFWYNRVARSRFAS